MAVLTRVQRKLELAEQVPTASEARLVQATTAAQNSNQELAKMVQAAMGDKVKKNEKVPIKSIR
jgi:hypothetical protein